MAKRKVHLFADCSGHYYSSPQDVLFTDNVRECTCGQCKGRVLEALRARDWATLNDETVAVLSANLRQDVVE